MCFFFDSHHHPRRPPAASAPQQPLANACSLQLALRGSRTAFMHYGSCGATPRAAHTAYPRVNFARDASFMALGSSPCNGAPPNGRGALQRPLMNS